MKKQPFFRLKVTDETAALIRGTHPILRKKIRESLKTILSDPESGKLLKDELQGLKSFQVSRFRIIYRVSKRHIAIIAIGPRRTIYEETFRLISKEKRIF